MYSSILKKHKIIFGIEHDKALENSKPWEYTTMTANQILKSAQFFYRDQFYWMLFNNLRKYECTGIR